MGLSAFLGDEEAEPGAGLVADIRCPRKRVEEEFPLRFRNPDPPIANREGERVRPGLHAELVHEGTTLDDQEWSRRQLAFLESHSWFTDQAASRWDAAKAEHIVELRRRVGG